MIAKSFVSLLEGKILIHTINKRSVSESFFGDDSSCCGDPVGDDGGIPYMDYRVATYEVETCPYCHQDVPERGGIFWDQDNDKWFVRCCNKEFRNRPKNRSPQEQQFFARLQITVNPSPVEATTEISSEASDEGVELQPV
jgi:ribosomal protein L24E